jgi:hypothetical protein
MEININNRSGFELVFKADNVLVTEDIEERIYSKTEDGKSDFSRPPFRDISNEVVEQFVAVLADIAYYRKREFDSSDLIEVLFDKLPEDKAEVLLNKLKR